MKKIALSILASAVAATVWAIGPTYDANNYEALAVEANTGASEFGLSEYRENSVVYFRTDSTAKEGSLDGVTIYKAKVLKSGELSTPERCTELEKIGVTGAFAYDASEDKIYFSKYNKTSKVYQLYESYFEADGAWSDPQPVYIKNVTPTRTKMSFIQNANWEYTEKGASIVQPALAKGGDRLYFVSDMKKGSHGKTDIWYTDREGEDWGTPVNLGDSVNTKCHDAYPQVVGDSLLYYASDCKGNGGYDLFVARIKDDGSAPTEYEPLGELFNTGSNDYNLVSTPQGVYFISSRGDQSDDIYHLFGLPQPEEIVLAELPTLPAQASETEPEFHHVLFFFDFDKSNMQAGTDPDVQQLLTEIALFPDRRFELAGHTDERGTDAYNNRLSVRRANTVKDVLVKNGVDPKRLVVKGYGKTQPVVPNAETDADHARNRRVEVNFYNEQPSNAK